METARKTDILSEFFAPRAASRRSIGETRSALCPAAGKHLAPVAGRHSFAEAVLLFAVALFRLISAKHDFILLSCYAQHFRLQTGENEADHFFSGRCKQSMAKPALAEFRHGRNDRFYKS